ncbi:hypothetical protein GCM10023223_42410 [Stackebrandtia albiflava]
MTRAATATSTRSGRHGAPLPGPPGAGVTGKTGAGVTGSTPSTVCGGESSVGVGGNALASAPVAARLVAGTVERGTGRRYGVVAPGGGGAEPPPVPASRWGTTGGGAVVGARPASRVGAAFGGGAGARCLAGLRVPAGGASSRPAGGRFDGAGVATAGGS